MPEVIQISDETRASSGFRALFTGHGSHSHRVLTFGAQVTNAIIDLVFPAACAGCGRIDRVWCARCDSQLHHSPVLHLLRELQNAEQVMPVVSTGWHTGLLQTAVHALKYENLPQLAHPLGERLAAALANLDWPMDVVMPVPLHLERLRSRGYNQAALLAQALSTISGVPLDTSTLRRHRDTRSQVGLNQRERLENMNEAFYAEAVEGRAVLVLDDVATTGATLLACASALYASGASMVCALTVTAAPDHRDQTNSSTLPISPAGDQADNQYTFDNRTL